MVHLASAAIKLISSWFQVQTCALERYDFLVQVTRPGNFQIHQECGNGLESRSPVKVCGSVKFGDQFGILLVMATFKTCQTKCLVDYLISLGYICLTKVPKNFQPCFAWHIVSYLSA